MSFESWREKRKDKKDEKALKKEKEKLAAMTERNTNRIGRTHEREEIKQKSENQEWLKRTLDEKELDAAIQKARTNLYIQRDRLTDRIRRYNLEYASIKEKPDYIYKDKDAKRCSTASKNAIYALALVEAAINRIDDIKSEYEWRQIIKDLTNGYKTVNAISVGSDLLTRLVFCYQKFKMEKKGDISVHAMEHYFRKPIDQLLQESDINQAASEMIVDNSALTLRNEEDILNAIKYGQCYSVNPFELTRLAEEQSIIAEKTGGQSILENPTEVSENEVPIDFMDILRS